MVTILWKKRKQTSLCCVEGESQNRLTAANTGFEQSVKPLTLKAPNVCPLFMLTPSSSLSSTSPSSSCFSACLASASTVRLEFRVACPSIVPLFTASLCTFIAGFDSQLWPFRQCFVFPFRRRTMMLFCSKYHRKLHMCFTFVVKCIRPRVLYCWACNYLKSGTQVLRSCMDHEWFNVTYLHKLKSRCCATTEKWIKYRVSDGFA